MLSFGGETTTKVVFRRKFILTIFIKFTGINIILLGRALKTTDEGKINEVKNDYNNFLHNTESSEG